MAVASAIIAAVGAIYSAEQQSKAAEAQAVQIRAENAVSAAKLARERRAALREKRIMQAQIEQASEATGVAGSSGAISAPGILATQFATNLGFQNTLQAARNVRDDALIAQSKAQVKSQLGQSVSSIGFSAFQGAGGFGSIFSSDTTTG